MPIVMQCPFFKRSEKQKLGCEGGVLSFYDKKSKEEYVTDFCANPINWRKCTICHNLEKYYEREETR